MSGGTGDDTYVFASGEGQDLIEDRGGQDDLHFTDIHHQRLLFRREDNDLVINIRDCQDSVTMKGAFSVPDNVVETIKTSDNATLQVSALLSAMRELRASETVVSLAGSRYLSVKDGRGRVSRFGLNRPVWAGTEDAGYRGLPGYVNIKNTTSYGYTQLLNLTKQPLPVIIDRQPPVNDLKKRGKVIFGNPTGKNVISVAHGDVSIRGGSQADELSVITSGSNALYGFGGPDVLQVTGGHNRLYGGVDSDTYRVGGNVSHAIINDTSGNKDILSLEHAGIDATHVRLKREGDDLKIMVAERRRQSENLVTIRNQFKAGGLSAIEVLNIVGVKKTWNYTLVEAMSSMDETGSTYALADVADSKQLMKSSWLTGTNCSHWACARQIK